jgi:hypothetical protein
MTYAIIIDPGHIPRGTLCRIDALRGVVWMAQGHPAQRWLADMDLDAWAATVGEYDAGNHRHDVRGYGGRGPGT